MAKRADIYFRRQGQALVPDSAADAMLLEADYAEGKVIRAKLSYPRSISQNSYYWAGLLLAVQHLPEGHVRKYPTKEKLHKALLEVCGFSTIHYPLQGPPHTEVDSAAFDKMTGADFNAYFQNARRQFAEVFSFDPWDELERRKVA